MNISRKKVYLSLAVFSAVFLLGLTDYPASCKASVVNSNVHITPQKKAKVVKLKVSVKKKTKKSSIKLTGKTGKYFTVIISVNGQEKTTLTANKKGAFKTSIPLDVGTNTVIIQVSSSDGSIIKNITKIITRTGKKTTETGGSTGGETTGGTTGGTVGSIGGGTDSVGKKEKDKRNTFYMQTVIGIAFENYYSGIKPYSASNYTIGDTTYFSYIGNKISSSSSVTFGTTFYNFIGEKPYSASNYSSFGSYYCSYIGDEISSCTNYSLGSIYYTLYGYPYKKISSCSNYTLGINSYYSYIGDKLNSVANYSSGLGTYYIN